MMLQKMVVLCATGTTKKTHNNVLQSATQDMNTLTELKIMKIVGRTLTSNGLTKQRTQVPGWRPAYVSIPVITFIL